ncbi:MAG TPA: aryl-sulfate sulfotransferase [Flavipsychrobacter sp.]
MIRFLGYIAIVLVINCGQYVSLAQVTPANRSVLNYRLIGFSVPEQEGVTEYEFEVYKLTISDSGTYKEDMIFKKKKLTNKCIELVPGYQTTYTWKVNYYHGNEKTGSSDIYRFATGYNPFADTSKYRINVEVNTIKDNDLFFFIDETRCLYNPQGDPLWYLPDIPGIVDEQTNIRDLKLSPLGTITFLTYTNAYEIDYNGKVLWQAPNDGRVSGDSTEHYHHEFTRLNNGNYMIACSKKTLKEIPQYVNKAAFKKDVMTVRGNKSYKYITFGTIVEYDTSNKIVWLWTSGDHFTDKDLFTEHPSGALRTQTHFNSFTFDEESKELLLSFRNISRIVKIKYPSGKEITSYGESYNTDKPIQGDGMFYGQHTPRFNNKGNIYLFNNNNSFTENGDSARSSSIIIFKEPVKNDEEPTKLWEYKCDLLNLQKPFAAAGGSVFELNNESILVSMGDVNCSFVVTPGKVITWKAYTQKYNPAKGWEGFGYGYRNSAIQSHKELSGLIFK